MTCHSLSFVACSRSRDQRSLGLRCTPLFAGRRHLSDAYLYLHPYMEDRFIRLRYCAVARFIRPQACTARERALRATGVVSVSSNSISAIRFHCAACDCNAMLPLYGEANGTKNDDVVSRAAGLWVDRTSSPQETLRFSRSEVARQVTDSTWREKQIKVVASLTCSSGGDSHALRVCNHIYHAAPYSEHARPGWH